MKQHHLHANLIYTAIFQNIHSNAFYRNSIKFW